MERHQEMVLQSPSTSAVPYVLRRLIVALVLVWSLSLAGCKSAPPTQTPGETNAAYLERLAAWQDATDRSADVIDLWGGLLAPVTGGISLIVAGGLAEATRRWGRSQGAMAVARSIEDSRTGASGAGAANITFNKAKAGHAQDLAGVRRAVERAT